MEAHAAARLEVELLRHIRIPRNGVARRGDCRRKLGEKERNLRDGKILLGAVVMVVHPNAYDLLRIEDRREQLCRVKLHTPASTCLCGGCKLERILTFFEQLAHPTGEGATLRLIRGRKIHNM